jgi:hypothetical protein
MKFVESSPAKGTRTYVVRAKWDDEAKVWVAASDDVPGLVTEASSTRSLPNAIIGAVPRAD